MNMVILNKVLSKVHRRTGLYMNAKKAGIPGFFASSLEGLTPPPKPGFCVDSLDEPPGDL
jgi:hypothetical protein